MALVEIPLVSDLDSYLFQIDLDNVTYEFEFNWNLRAERWSFILRTGDKVDLVAGLYLDVNQNILSRFKDPRLPKGQLALLDKRGFTLAPGRNDLGTNIILYYNGVIT